MLALKHWAERVVLYWKSGRLYAKADKLYAKADKLRRVALAAYMKGPDFFPEGNKLYAERDKLKAEGGRLYIEAHELAAMASARRGRTKLNLERNNVYDRFKTH
jgi:hypothetical protein